MHRYSWLLTLTLITIAVIYIPFSQQRQPWQYQQQQLVIDMDNMNSMISDKTSPQKLRLHSEHLHYEEATNESHMHQFSFFGFQQETAFSGHSQQARLQGDTLNLTQAVHLYQRTAQHPENLLLTEQLTLNTRTHSITSPGRLTLTNEQQSIHADSLKGNYETGWYEFTQHVRSQWK
jgi:LPS export ABC transporter protein LptC